MASLRARGGGAVSAIAATDGDSSDADIESNVEDSAEAAPKEETDAVGEVSAKESALENTAERIVEECEDTST